jgi:phospholipase C
LDYTRRDAKERELSGDVEILAVNRDKQKDFTVEARDNAYSNPRISKVIASGRNERLEVRASKSAGWYDLSIHIAGSERFEKRYAGRVETGRWSTSDPAMAARSG